MNSIIEIKDRDRNCIIMVILGHSPWSMAMAVGTIGEWLKLVPFLLGDEQFILGGGGGLAVFKNKYPGRQTP